MYYFVSMYLVSKIYLHLIHNNNRLPLILQNFIQILLLVLIMVQHLFLLILHFHFHSIYFPHFLKYFHFLHPQIILLLIHLLSFVIIKDCNNHLMIHCLLLYFHFDLYIFYLNFELLYIILHN